MSRSSDLAINLEVLTRPVEIKLEIFDFGRLLTACSLADVLFEIVQRLIHVSLGLSLGLQYGIDTFPVSHFISNELEGRFFLKCLS